MVVPTEALVPAIDDVDPERRQVGAGRGAGRGGGTHLVGRGGGGDRAPRAHAAAADLERGARRVRHRERRLAPPAGQRSRYLVCHYHANVYE